MHIIPSGYKGLATTAAATLLNSSFRVGSFTCCGFVEGAAKYEYANALKLGKTKQKRMRMSTLCNTYQQCSPQFVVPFVEQGRYQYPLCIISTYGTSN